MKLLLRGALIISLFCTSCDMFNDPDSGSYIQTYKNIRWDLISADTSNKNIDLTKFRTLSLAFVEPNIWGDDGCNHLRGQYRISHDTLILINAGITALYCFPEDQFDFCLLFRSPRVLSLSRNKLTLRGGADKFAFTSSYLENVSNKPYVNKYLSLDNSDHPEWDYFETLHFLTQLILGSDRSHRLVTYDQLSDTLKIISDYSGFYGLNDKSDIQFTTINYASYGNNFGYNEFVSAIPHSTSIEYSNGILHLTNKETNYYFKLTK